MRERRIAPSHVKNYCFEDESDITYRELREQWEDECSFLYKIKCNCGSENFTVLYDEHPSIFAKCCKCGNTIIVYDLKYYPCAIKLKEELPVKKIAENVPVYISYEYGDDFLEDENYNVDDVTAATAFIKKEKEIIKILDDETA